MTYFNLLTRVVELSSAKTFQDAKQEWVINNVYYAQAPNFETCICGKYPIVETIEMKNKITGNRIIVGNCCVNKFFDISACNKIFYAIRRSKFNEATVLYAYERKVINDWEAKFCLNVAKKRKLSHKQQIIYNELNQKVLRSFNGK